MTVAEAIDLMKREGGQLAKPIAIEGMPDMVFECSFAESGATATKIAEVVSECPLDLIDFWKITSDARLFEDISYGQWGLEIFNPKTALIVTEECQRQRSRDFQAGDLVIGRFLGDSDLLIMRCDHLCSDFGSILVALPIDPRKDWYSVADSLSSFFELYIKAAGNKVWAVAGG